MKPDWMELGETLEKSKKVLIGDVDCTAKGNEELCKEQGVSGYPTLNYYLPGDREAKKYEGERDLKTLLKFAKSLGPSCGPDHLKKCTEEERAELEGYMAQPADELAAALAILKDEVAAKEAVHNELLKSLQVQFTQSQQALQELKAEKEPHIKLMSAALSSKQPSEEEPAAAKQEV